MTNPLFVDETLPSNSREAMQEFDDRYLASIGAVQPPSWTDMGELIPTRSILTTFPLGSLATKYLQLQGDDRYKTFLDAGFDLRAEEFQAGHEAKLIDLLSESFAYRSWSQTPQRWAIAEARLRNRAIAALLENGQNVLWGSVGKPIDGQNFFSATHKADFTSESGGGTWSNYQTSGKSVLSVTNLEAEVTAMKGVLDENGEKIGIEPDTILVPTALDEPLKNLLAQAMIPAGPLSSTSNAQVNNPYYKRFNVVHVPEFTDANDWYLVDSKALSSLGLPPWISARWTVPNPALALRHFDESSDFFKTTGKIRVSSHIWYGFALAFPWAIRKVTGA